MGWIAIPGRVKIEEKVSGTGLRYKTGWLDAMHPCGAYTVFTFPLRGGDHDPLTAGCYNCMVTGLAGYRVGNVRVFPPLEKGENGKYILPDLPARLICECNRCDGLIMFEDLQIPEEMERA
jgi:hypothetical protein